MPRKTRAFTPALIAILASCLLLACARPPKASPPDIVTINAANFTVEALRQPGVTLVLFHNPGAWQSQNMYQRLDYLAKSYKGKLKFCAFAWDVADDPSPYRLEILPTLVMYRDGYEVDRMRGVSDDPQALAELNDDLELWILSTGLQLKQDPVFQASFGYMFKNSFKLLPENDF